MWQRVESLSDCLSLQNDLDAIYNWSLVLSLSFESGKTSLVSFYSNHSPIEFPYTINGQGVPRNNTVRDLGVILKSILVLSQNSTSSFGLHVYFGTLNCVKIIILIIVK